MDLIDVVFELIQEAYQDSGGSGHWYNQYDGGPWDLLRRRIEREGDWQLRYAMKGLSR